MKQTRENVKVQVMGKEFVVACDANEKGKLINATRFLDEQIQDVQRQGKIIGNDRIAIMVAINLASELLDLRQQADDSNNLESRLHELSAKIEREIQS